MKAVSGTLGVARSNLAEQIKARPAAKVGRRPLPEETLVADIKKIIAGLPSYGYRRIWAILRRQAQESGQSAPNHKRVFRVMKAHGLLLEPHCGAGEERRHDGKVAMDASNLRWCSDGFEIGCDNGEKVRVAFALDCCDREAGPVIAAAGSSRAPSRSTGF